MNFWIWTFYMWLFVWFSSKYIYILIKPKGVHLSSVAVEIIINVDWFINIYYLNVFSFVAMNSISIFPMKPRTWCVNWTAVKTSMYPLSDCWRRLLNYVKIVGDAANQLVSWTNSFIQLLINTENVLGFLICMASSRSMHILSYFSIAELWFSKRI